MASAAARNAAPLSAPKQALPRGSHNPWLGYLRPVLWGKEKDPFDYNADFRGAFVAKASTTSQVDVQINGDSHFVCTAISATAFQTNDTTALNPTPSLVLLKTSQANRPLMDRAVHFNNITGTAQLPFYLPFPLVLKPKEVLSALLTNQEATDRNYQLTFKGFKVFGFPGTQPGGALPMSPGNPFLAYLPARYWKLAKAFFVYTANFTGTFLAANGAITNVTLNIDGDSDFYILGANFTAFTTDDLTQAATPAARIAVNDQSGGRQFQSSQGGVTAGNWLNNSTHISNFAGTGQNPGFWAMPRLVMGGSALQVSLHNQEGTDRNYRISFFGFKIFPFPWGEDE